jgi:hypothetical protein
MNTKLKTLLMLGAFSASATYADSTAFLEVAEILKRCFLVNHYII